ncbi:MAG: replication-associated recombination protein A, partial [Mobilicoccus sp.]|nr:replication-associated recombination protein A [Mobilicoccus sp.]
LAPKSNASYMAINAAMADVRAGKIGPVPVHLRGTGHASAAKRSGQAHGGYVYAHDEPDSVATQQYLPDVLAGADYYHPKERGFEARMVERWRWLRERLGR